MSIAQWLGLSPEFWTAILLIAVCLALAPYLENMTIGAWVVPRLVPGKKRIVKIGGPLIVIVLIAAGVPLNALRPKARLELLAADATDRGQIDVVIANSGATAAVLTRIEIEVLRDHGQLMRPVLDASATYRIPLGDARAGQCRAATIRHVVPPATTERILIALETARVLDVRVRILVADGVALTGDVRLWQGRE